MMSSASPCALQRACPMALATVSVPPSIPHPAPAAILLVAANERNGCPSVRSCHEATSQELFPAGPRAAREGAAGLASLGVKLAVAVLGLGVNVVLARWLGPADYGVYAFGITITCALSAFASAGMPFAAIRHLPEYVARGAWAEVAGFRRASILVTAAGSLLCVVGVLLLAGVLHADQVLTTALVWSAVLVAPLAFVQTLATLLQARGRVALPEAMQSLIRQGMTLLFLGFGGRDNDGVKDQVWPSLRPQPPRRWQPSRWPRCCGAWISPKFPLFMGGDMNCGDGRGPGQVFSLS